MHLCTTANFPTTFHTRKQQTMNSYGNFSLFNGKKLAKETTKLFVSDKKKSIIKCNYISL